MWTRYERTRSPISTEARGRRASGGRPRTGKPIKRSDATVMEGFSLPGAVSYEPSDGASPGDANSPGITSLILTSVTGRSRLARALGPGRWRGSPRGRWRCRSVGRGGRRGGPVRHRPRDRGHVHRLSGSRLGSARDRLTSSVPAARVGWQRLRTGTAVAMLPRRRKCSTRAPSRTSWSAGKGRPAVSSPAEYPTWDFCVPEVRGGRTLWDVSPPAHRSDVLLAVRHRSRHRDRSPGGSPPRSPGNPGETTMTADHESTATRSWRCRRLPGGLHARGGGGAPHLLGRGRHRGDHGRRAGRAARGRPPASRCSSTPRPPWGSSKKPDDHYRVPIELNPCSRRQPGNRPPDDPPPGQYRSQLVDAGLDGEVGLSRPRPASIRGAEADTAAFVAAMHTASGRGRDGPGGPVRATFLHPPARRRRGRGTWTLAFLPARPGSTATLFDLPHAIATRPVPASPPPHGRPRHVRGRRSSTTTKFPRPPTSPGSAAIVHQHSRQHNALFAKVHRAAAARRHDRAATSYVARPHRALAGALFAINMLANTNTGTTFTFAELAEDLQAAGFVGPALPVEASPCIPSSPPRNPEPGEVCT